MEGREGSGREGSVTPYCAGDRRTRGVKEGGRGREQAKCRGEGKATEDMETPEGRER